MKYSIVKGAIRRWETTSFNIRQYKIYRWHDDLKKLSYIHLISLFLSVMQKFDLFYELLI